MVGIEGERATSGLQAEFLKLAVEFALKLSCSHGTTSLCQQVVRFEGYVHTTVIPCAVERILIERGLSEERTEDVFKGSGVCHGSSHGTGDI